MSQYQIDQSNIAEDFERLTTLISNLERYDLIHDEKYELIARLVAEWMVETFPRFNERFLSSAEEGEYSDANEWLASEGTDWWLYEVKNFSDEEKELIFRRFRDTLFYCMYSNFSDDDAIRAKIDAAN